MRRVLILAYGFISYVAFLVVFLYLVGFVGDVLVPKSVDSGPGSNPVLALVIDTGLVSLFALQHLIMARQRFKRWWVRFVPEPMERSTFVLAASSCLILLFLFWQPIPVIVWKTGNQVLQWILRVAFLLGWILVVASTFLIDHFDLFGLRQVYLHFRGKAYNPVSFQVNSLYRSVRHPMMLGFLIALWSTPVMTIGHFILAAEFTAFIFIGLWFEERDLVRYFGQTYLAYRQETPLLIPGLKRRASSSSERAVESAAETSFRCSKKTC
ncbi:MAG: isoprenylcysteine carboxylmethyltransferase family protein [Deltaproteobacteria bacterium]|nr:MAG: isoprenylcysteine carboxylmethyltransferase family protein [Deltaproteobacteria bacterium]